MKKRLLLYVSFGFAMTSMALVLLAWVPHGNAGFWISFIFLELALALIAAAVIWQQGRRAYVPIRVSFLTLSLLYAGAVTVICILLGWLLPMKAGAYLCIHLALLALLLALSFVFFHITNRQERSNAADQIVLTRQRAVLLRMEEAIRLARRLPDSVRARTEELLQQLCDSVRFWDLDSEKSETEGDLRIQAAVTALLLEMENLVEIQSEDLTAIDDAILKLQDMIASRNFQIRSKKAKLR